MNWKGKKSFMSSSDGSKFSLWSAGGMTFLGWSSEKTHSKNKVFWSDFRLLPFSTTMLLDYNYWALTQDTSPLQGLCLEHLLSVSWTTLILLAIGEYQGIGINRFGANWLNDDHNIIIGH
uniref:Uncharacterized protein n=1 Tax=Homalodisca liturata TaxID=320908 RepID=A0A1B6HB36_9HEMI